MVAESAISWGEAVLPTAISTVAGGRLFYRGRDAVALAARASLEETAALLWNVSAFPLSPRMLSVRAELSPVEAALSMLAAAAHNSDPTQGRARASLVAEAAVLLRATAALGADLADGGGRRGFARGWNCSAHCRAICVALVVLADHGLSA